MSRIDLGLQRISRLLNILKCPQKSWKTIHVAGTNGKGSVCAYLTSVLNQCRIKTGTFTSPHLIHRWDSISINNKSIEEAEFAKVEEYVRKINETNEIGASEFELLTATAFEIFLRNRIDVAVMEVGLGGLNDATNVFEPGELIATIITSIGLDHVEFLGDSLTEIARHKAGIIKRGVPIVADGTNAPEVLKVLEQTAAAHNAPLTVVNNGNANADNVYQSSGFGSIPLTLALNGRHQRQNLSLALAALDIAKQHGLAGITNASVINGLKSVSWPGRLQFLRINGTLVLLDGAHNVESAEVLREFVHSQTGAPLTWLFAFSSTKKAQNVMSVIFKDKQISDRTIGIYTTEFGPVEGMAWVKPQDRHKLADIAAQFHANVESLPLSEALTAATSQKDGLTVVCGSLYLVSDIIRKISQSALH
ncbi:hypothetical protein CANCADRAFT_3313 [Tortispora caseinolytica NRRL Y-17796]|uniref:Dihydrofolate synthetase n=1 Tax=Tortispora caseinolytica NRRL Y-17796 TaxID=767744 RepID=A0A1E4TA80_9ASCO|nr:hypothetical protein CANCADRAFT_3313 [Tortispora caseinolytica NRRL Y-17796]